MEDKRADEPEAVSVEPTPDAPREPVEPTEPEAPDDTEPTAVLPPVPVVTRTPAAQAYARLQPEPAVPPSSPLDGFVPDDRPRTWRRNLAIVASVILVLGGAYVALLWTWADRVPPGTSVAGVDVGGLAADVAVVTLQDSLRAATTEPLNVTAGERMTTFDPVSAGLTLDARATVDTLTGLDLTPAALWRQVFGAGPAAPVTVVDEAALAAAVEATADALVTPAVDGTVQFVDGVAHGTKPVDGLAVEPDAAAATLRDTWLTAARPLALPTVVVEPDITQAEVDAAVVDLGRPIAGGPVSVAVAGQLAQLSAAVVTSATTFVPRDGVLVAEMDGEALREALLARTADLVTEPEDARFEFIDGVPTIVAGDPGTDVDPDALAEAVVAAATAENRTARITLAWTDPQETAAELGELGVVAKVSEFATNITADADRNHNLATAAERITGTLLLPGDTFSLIDTIGPVTAESGYRGAPVVVEGRLTDGVGGGLSQVATTTYNAAFLAGLEDVEHTPHSYYFSRYPEGREATVYSGVLDLKFRNNTPHGVLMQAWLEGGQLHVATWSTPYWEVETSTSGRSGVTAPRTVYDTSATCTPQAAGSPGFTVTVYRTLRLDGVEQESQDWTWRYQPQNAVVCGPEPAPVPPPGPTQ